MIGTVVRRLPTPPATALGLVLAAVTSVQFGGALAATLIPRIGPAGTATVRLVLAAIVLSVAVRPRLSGRTRADLSWALGFAVALAAMNMAFYAALERLPIGVAVTCEFVGPLGLAAALSRRPRDLLAVVLAAVGVLAVNGHDLGRTNWVGVGFALTAGGCWAAYILLAKQVGRRYAQLDGLALAMVLSAVLALPFGIFGARTALLGWHVLVVGAVVALLSSVLPYSLELQALRRMRPAVFGVLMSLEPAMAALAGLLILNQRLSVVQVLGMACVVVASITISWRRGSAPVTP